MDNNIIIVYKVTFYQLVLIIKNRVMENNIIIIVCKVTFYQLVLIKLLLLIHMPLPQFIVSLSVQCLLQGQVVIMVQPKTSGPGYGVLRVGKVVRRY